MFGVLLYFLTMNPDVQSKLQDDIDDLFDSKRPGEPVTQDDVTGLKYLDQVVCEGQRLGCFPFTARLCTKSWAVPGSDFVIPADTRVVIPIVRNSRQFIFLSSHISPQVGLHYDPEHFPDPERFDPDRFENKGSYDSITFQTFGTGPRWRPQLK